MSGNRHELAADSRFLRLIHTIIHYLSQLQIEATFLDLDHLSYQIKLQSQFMLSVQINDLKCLMVLIM